MDLAKAMDIPLIYPDDVDEAFKLHPDGNDAVERLLALSDERAQAAAVELDQKYTSSFKANSPTNGDSFLFDSELQEATAAAAFDAESDAESVGNLSFSDLEHDPVVTPLADSDTTSITSNGIGEVPLELPTPDGNAQLDSFMDGFDSFLEQLQDPLPVLNMDQSEVDNNESLQNEPPLPFLQPLPSQLIPCPPDKIDDEDVTTPKLLRHYLYYHFFNGRKCSNCSVQVISQQSGQYNYCRMCHTRKESEYSIDVGVERDDNPNDVDDTFSDEELEKVRNLTAYQAFCKKPLRNFSKGSENAYRRKNLLVGSLQENDLSPPTYATFTRCVHGMGGSLRWYHIPILLRIFSLPFGYHVDHPELMSTMEELVRKESQPSNGNFFFSLHTFRKAMRKSEIRVAKREQIGRNMSFIIRATLMMLDLIDIADSHCMVDVLINAFEADEVFPSLDDRAIVKYFAALHFTTSIVIKQCTLEFKKTSMTEAQYNVADVYLARAHSGTPIVDLIRNVSLHGFIPALSDDINILNARYPQLGGFLHAAFNPSSLRSYLVAMAGNHNTFDPDQVYVAVMSGEGSCGGGAWLLPLFQVAYISHLVRTGYSSHFGRYCCAFRYHRRRKGGCSPHLISLRENNTCNDSDSSIRPTYQTFGPIRTDGTFENQGYPLMATMCRPHHNIEAMGVENFLNKTINTGVKQFDFNFDTSNEEKRDFERNIAMMTKKVIESSEDFKREHRLRDSVGRLYSLLLSQSGRDAEESSRDVASLIAPP